MSTEFDGTRVSNGWSCSALVPQHLPDNKVANNCDFLGGKQHKNIVLVVFFPGGDIAQNDDVTLP